MTFQPFTLLSWWSSWVDSVEKIKWTEFKIITIYILENEFLNLKQKQIYWERERVFFFFNYFLLFAIIIWVFI